MNAYVCMCVCVYVCMCVNVCVCVCMCIMCMYVYVSLGGWVYVCVFVSGCERELCACESGECVRSVYVCECERVSV